MYAVIRGTSVNQDGRTQGITVPNGDAQETNARAALAVAGIQPRDVGYVEAHGTGTPVGDPIEATALGRSLVAGREADRIVFVGSVKSNIGHLEGGAGIAGLIKAALAVHHRRIPAHLHFSQPHPELDLDLWRMAVPTKSQPWTAYYERAIATVNSFGFGGTNANVVIEEAPPTETPTGHGQADSPVVLTFSERTEQSLRALTTAHARLLRDRPVEVAGLAANLALRRTHHPHRLSVLATDAEDAANRLDRHHHDEAPAGVVSGRARETAGRVANAESHVVRAPMGTVNVSMGTLATWPSPRQGFTRLLTEGELGKGRRNIGQNGCPTLPLRWPVTSTSTSGVIVSGHTPQRVRSRPMGGLR